MVLKMLCNAMMAFLVFSCVEKTQIGLSVIESVDLAEALAFYQGYDQGGNTSIAFDASSSFKWSGESVAKSGGFGYFLADGTEVPYIKRDRDLGQTFKFQGNKEEKWTGITLKLGFGDNVIRRGTYGRPIAIQIFEVSGTPILNENGTTGEMSSLHGYPHNPNNGAMEARRDDFWEGESFNSIAVIQGFRFPSKTAFGFHENDDIDPDSERLKGRLLQFNFDQKSQINLKPGKSYAFLIMLEEMGDDYGFTLANHFDGNYPDGHGIRRDGRGIFPPPPADPMKPFEDEANKIAIQAAYFPLELSARTKLPVGTNGYPDVDTWRDLYFVIH